MAEQTLVKKLQMKPNSACLILQAPEGYLAMLTDLPAGSTITTELPAVGMKFDFVQLFVTHVADLEANARAAIDALKTGGLLWFCYPKKTSKIKTDLNRDDGWDVVSTFGYAGVRAIAIDESQERVSVPNRKSSASRIACSTGKSRIQFSVFPDRALKACVYYMRMIE